jgi:hypothetical protein
MAIDDPSYVPHPSGSYPEPYFEADDPVTGEVNSPRAIMNVSRWIIGETDKIAEALAKAQGAMVNAVMKKTNPHFRSKYADLAAIRDATVPALSENGLAIVQVERQDSRGQMWLVTAMLHTSGQQLITERQLPDAVDRPQVYGSALTYARRYSWSALCGIASEEDDDANEAQAAAPAQSRRAPAPGPNVMRRSEAPPPGDYGVPVAPEKPKRDEAAIKDAKQFKDQVEAAAKESDYAELDQLRISAQEKLTKLKATDSVMFQRLEESLSGIYTDGLIIRPV